MAVVAQSRIQDDVHPLLRHPKPIKRDSAKAQRMLGLITDSEEKLKELQREKSITTKWLERPMYQHLEVSDVESEKEEAEEERKEESIHNENKEESDAELLDRWTKPDRPTSFSSDEAMQPLAEPKTVLDMSFIKRRPDPISCLRPVSYNAQHLLSPEWTASPATMSPNTPGQRPVSSYLHSPNLAKSSISSASSVESDPRIAHAQTWTIPLTQNRANARRERPVSFQPQSFPLLGSPQLQQRPRPTSFATYHQRNRSNSKIASSRGLRNNSYPNFSRPISGIAPRAVPGENMENDVIYQRFGDDEVGSPSPSSPIRNALSGFEMSDDKGQAETKAKKRWSTIPQALKKLGRRGSSTAQESPKFEGTIDDLRRMNLTEENLHWHANEFSQAPSTPKNRLSGVDLIPTPTYSPFDVVHPHFESPLPPPFAPWADGPPSPAITADRRRSNGTSSLSPTRKAPPSRLSVENVPQIRPASFQSSRNSIIIPAPRTRTAPQQCPTVDIVVNPRTTTPSSTRGTPSLERTCILCKMTRPPSEFTNRRITANCWHEPATCLHCLQSWIEDCLATQGSNRCTCPECGENMAFEDVGVFANTSTSRRSDLVNFR